jgi:PAS domain S-box-containing protein
MFLENETDLTLTLGLVAAAAVLAAAFFLFLLIRVTASLARVKTALDSTSTGADRTERRMFTILQAIPVALVETDTSGKFTFANRAAHQLLGRKDAELLGLRFHSATWGITYPDGRLIPPDLLPAARALRGQTVKGFQHIMVNPNSRKKMLVSVTAMPIMNEAGEVIGSSSAIVETESLSTFQPDPEEELRSRYFDVAGVMLLALGRDGAVRDINRYGAEILGAPVEAIIGRDWFTDFLPAEDRKEAHTSFDEVIKGKREMPEQGEGWIVRADGEKRLLSWRGSAMFDERGRVSATLSSGQDVTDARAAEAAAREGEDIARQARAAADASEGKLSETAQALKDSETQFRGFTEALGEALWLYDPAEARMVFANPAYDTIWGDPRERLIEDPQHWRTLVHPDDIALMEAGNEQLARGEAREIEFRIRRPSDGAERILHDNAFVIRGEDGEIHRIAGIARDVTERRLAEAVVQESERKFRTLVEVAPQRLWSAQPDGGFDYVSPRWLEYTGAPAEANLGQGWLDAVHVDDRIRTSEAWSAAVRGEAGFDIEHRLRRQDGAVRWFKSRAVSLQDESGQVLRWYGSSTDITDVVDARDALALEASERASELAASTEARRKTDAALEQAQRLETVGRLTGGVAHDFNALLTVVIGALEMILRQADNPDRVTRVGEAALAASRRGERLTRQLLSFSRGEEFSTEPLDLETVIRGFEPMIRRAIDETHPVEVEIAPDLGEARLDAIQLQTALMNLVVNAKDAVESGGSVAVRANRVQLAEGEVSDVAAGDYARVSVVDTGAGMTPDVAARALEPFFTTRESDEHVGLGLAQVYGFARQSGGGVRIESAPGQGSTVSIFLPLTAPASAAIESAAE